MKHHYQKKEDFYSHLIIEYITSAGYVHKNCKIRKGFDRKKIGENHDLYVQGVLLLLADVF